jgi:catechol 2,3-dioxygenase-like lactoylglutathione lyase family enzyme
VHHRDVFDHVTIRVSDRAAAERFYVAVLATIGIAQTSAGEDFSEWDDFSLATADHDRPVTRGLHVGFAAPSREHVEAFWRAGVDAGYESDGEPGPRPQYSEDYYGAFLLDPDGNSIEAVHQGSMRDGGSIDHIWIRVSDVEASTRFYETVGPAAGFRVGHESAERTLFACVSGSFSVVAGAEPTENLHLAFAATDNETVDRFHREATAAGYRDNGPPGERAVYHPGYYGAFVLDPNGNNVEVVNHNRS